MLNKLTSVNPGTALLPSDQYLKWAAFFRHRNRVHDEILRNRFTMKMVPIAPVKSVANGCANCANYSDTSELIATYAAPGTLSLYAFESRMARIIADSINQQ